MKQVEHNGYLLQGVPEGAYGFEVYMVYLKKRLAWWENGLIGASQEACDLLSGNWQIISKASEITEEQAKGIVDAPIAEFDDGEPLYLWYGASQNMWAYIYETALESFHSLLKSHNLKPETTLILKKQ